MINNVILTGRLTQEPVMRKSQSGKSVVAFSLAVAREKNTTDFINCVAWNATAEMMHSYLHKGSLIGLEGRLQTRNYDDPNIPNRKVYVTEVIVNTVTFLESKKQQETATKVTETETYYPEQTITDEELPF